MIVWGGSNNNSVYFNSGGVYDPTADTWATTTTVGAPYRVRGHAAAWTGTKLIVWGGSNNSTTQEAYNTGGAYLP